MSASAAGRATIAAAGFAVVIPSVALVDRTSANGTALRATTYGDVSTSFAVLEVVVGVGLLVASLLLLAEHSTWTLGALAVAAAATWFAPVWVGWEGGSELVRSFGLVVAPLLPVVVLAVAAFVPRPAVGVWRVALLGLVAVLAIATTVASFTLALVREPIRDLDCWNDCTVNAFLVHDDVVLASRVGWVALGLAAAAGVAAALVAAIRFARAAPVTQRGSGPALATAALAGIALAVYAVALMPGAREVPDRPLYEGLFVARAAALLALAAALAWLAVRPGLVRGRVARLAVDLERSDAEGGLGRVLAAALGDPGLRLVYPIGPDERIVDADGRPAVLQPGRRVTPIVGDEGVVALVESDATTIDELERELGSSAHLALGNERLRAETLARLAEVTGSRARIVETADAARRRMERDLHDGAQQRMLALTYDLRVALTIAESSGNARAAAPLGVALERAFAASQELRDVAHGIFPAELTASGLAAALESLADVRPLRLAIDLRPGRRYRPEVETAAYAVVAEATEHGGHVGVTVAEEGGTLHVTVEGSADWRKRLVRLRDRVGAAGGSVRASERRLVALLPVPPPG